MTDGDKRCPAYALLLAYAECEEASDAWHDECQAAESIADAKAAYAKAHGVFHRHGYDNTKRLKDFLRDLRQRALAGAKRGAQ